MKITAKKYGGDDAYSWAVFRDSKPVFTGLSRSEVPYYKKKASEGFRVAQSKIQQDKVNE